MRTYQIQQRELAECTTAVASSTLPVGEIGQFIGQAIRAVTETLASQGLVPAGPPFARYHRIGTQEFEVEVGFPTTGNVSPQGEVRASTLPAGHAAVMTYIGPYEEMKRAYDALAEWVAHRDGEPTGDPWEVYFSDPAREPDPQKWRTDIVMPFRT